MLSPDQSPHRIPQTLSMTDIRCQPLLAIARFTSSTLLNCFRNAASD
ncbi:MAG: hypothetical protein ACFB8W_08705 [Elainellaceae cyanobacterium]